MSICNRQTSTRPRAAWLLALATSGLIMLQAGCGADAIDEQDGDGGSGTNLGTDDAFTRIYQSPTFQKCSECHAPGAPGRVAGIESTQNWSTRDAAYASLKGMASGLTGNFAGCNGVPLLGSNADTSLLVAALDEDTRDNFTSDKPDCNSDAISDMTLKLGAPVPAALLAQLKAWINAGAPNK